MRPHHRPRVGRRRDNGVRQIRSNVAPSYPGVDVPIADPSPQDASLGDDARRLNAALDTGIAVETRADRAAANAQRRQRIAVVGLIVAGIALVSAAVGWRYVSDRLAAMTPLVGDSAAAATRSAGHTATSATRTAGAAKASATPIFAHYKSLQLHLPVAMSSLTEIGFHQASYAWALPMKTTMKDAVLSKIATTRSTGRDRAAEPSGPDAVMTGYVLRMWRNRPGKPDTAADVGALAGTTILSPVTGTVVRIKPYKLYGRYPDYEMHIIPDGTSGLDIVMIHLTDISCSVGQRVEAGITPVAKIRKFSNKFHDQLADYTQSPGDHVHVQVNNSNYRGYKGLDGAVDPADYGDANGGD